MTPASATSDEPSEKRSFIRQQRWQMTIFLAFAAALNFADRAAMSAVLPALRADLALSDVALGMLGSCFLWSYALGSPFAGRLADSISRSKIIVFSLLGWSLVTALTGMVDSLGALLTLRVALGLTECLFFPATFALIAHYHSTATRARAMSFVSIGINCGMVVGGSVAGFLAEHYGWRFGFFAFGIAGIVLALLSRPFLPKSPPVTTEVAEKRPSFLEALKYLSRVPTYYAMVAESMMSGMGMWIFFAWLPLFFRETFSMSLAGAGFAGTFMLQISVMLGIFVGGWISDRVSMKAPHRRVLLYGTAYLLAAPFLLVFLGAPPFATVTIGISAFSFCRGLGQSNDHPTLCEIVPPNLRSTAIGLMNSCATASGGFGVFIAGFLKREQGLSSIFASVALAYTIAGALMLFTFFRFSRSDFERARTRDLASVA